jgi:hypothetical protein
VLYADVPEPIECELFVLTTSVKMARLASFAACAERREVRVNENTALVPVHARDGGNPAVSSFL